MSILLQMIKYIPNYTVVDYEQWQGDWELWNGVAVAMTPSPFGPHQYVAANCAGELRSAVKQLTEPYFVLPEIDWCIGNDTVVRPDVVVVADRIPQRHLEVAPVLIVEVLSKSTQEKDRTAKHNLYQSQGVQYYLLVDPGSQSLEVFELIKGTYQQIPARDHLQLHLSQNCTANIRIENIFT